MDSSNLRPVPDRAQTVSDRLKIGDITGDNRITSHYLLLFLSKLADCASASTLHTATNNLRSDSQVNGCDILRCAPALRVMLVARYGSSST